MARVGSAEQDEREQRRTDIQVRRLGENYLFDFETQMNMSKRDKKNFATLRRFEAVKWFTEASELSEGQTFGDRALTSDVIRVAKIATVTTCELAVLSRDDLSKVLKKVEQKIQ